MNTPLSLTEREEHLLTLAALGELTPAEQEEWQRCVGERPELADRCREWRDLAGRLASQQAGMPEQVAQRLNTARAGAASLRQRAHAARPRWNTFVRVALPLAAVITLGFWLLQEPAPLKEAGTRSGPVSFPAQEVQWVAPSQETHLLQPTVVWKGTPGRTYDVELTDDTGRVLARAEEVQSPWLIDTPLPAGAAVTVTLRQTGEKGAATHAFHIHPQATPLQGDLLAQMKALAETGNKTDAFMLLLRLPEDGLTPEEYTDWKKRLTP